LKNPEKYQSVQRSFLGDFTALNATNVEQTFLTVTQNGSKVGVQI
jgi:hypothetical protein